MAREAFEEIVENFELFDDWEDRYRYVIELGREMEPIEDALKTDGSRVKGCASQVWLIPEIEREGGAERLYFRGDSDAMIVRGLIAVLRALYCGATLDDVARIDAESELGRLGLENHLSSQRSNGLKAMVQRLREIAMAAAA